MNDDIEKCSHLVFFGILNNQWNGSCGIFLVSTVFHINEKEGKYSFGFS